MEKDLIKIGKVIGQRDIISSLHLLAVCGGGTISLETINKFSEDLTKKELEFDIHKYETKEEKELREISIKVFDKYNKLVEKIL